MQKSKHGDGENEFANHLKFAGDVTGDLYGKVAGVATGNVMRVPQNNFTHRANFIQREDKKEKEEEKKTKVSLQLTEPDFLSMRSPYLNRNVPHLWDPESALGVWRYNLNFFKSIGLDGNLAAKAANLTAPLFIDSQLKAGNPTFWEKSDKELNTTSIIGSVPLLNFDASFKNMKFLPFLRKKPLDNSSGSAHQNESFIQRKCSHCEEEEVQRKPLTSFIQKKQGESSGQITDEEEIDEDIDDNDMEMPASLVVQKKGIGNEGYKNLSQIPSSPFIQKKANNGEHVAGDDISDQIQATKGGGQALPEPAKNFMEKRFGADFSDVHIHTGEYASKLSDQLSAQAFTVGNDIYFNSGKFAPGTNQGKQLLAHELTHTIQQGGTRVNSSTRVQRSFWSFIKKTAGAAWSGIKKVGKWIGVGAKKVWQGIKWFGSQLIDKIAGVFQRFAFWMTQLPVRVFRLLSGLWAGLKTFKPWTLSWWKSLAEIDTWKNFLKWIGSTALQILEIGGIGEVYETIQDFVKFNTRTLNASEINAGKSIFGNTINFDFVRVDEHAVIGPAFSKRAYTSFHTINSWGTEKIDVMIHELTHVWQYENTGAIYMPQAIHAQVWGAGYEYGGVAELQLRQAAGKGLLSFNREQQAQIVQDFYLLRQNGSIPGRSAGPADIPVYAGFIKAISSLNTTQLTTPV